jgi:hypothetical protein
VDGALAVVDLTAWLTMPSGEPDRAALAGDDNLLPIRLTAAGTIHSQPLNARLGAG